MEGLGYWLFLLLLYLLSMMMKKRQQNATRRSLEADEPAEQTPDWAQSSFFKNLFGDLAQEDLVEPEVEYEMQPEAEILPPEKPSEIVEELRIEKEKPRSEFEQSTTDAYKHHIISGEWETLFTDIAGIRRAIVLKEVLDRPRALKRNIR